jgi:ribonuclease G
MSNILVINSTSHESRVALVENGIISEFHVERKKGRGIVGNVYKGRVLRVLPGMQAAFVDIGQEKAAFLYVSDVYNLHRDLAQGGEGGGRGGRGKARGPIEERLEEGQHVLVQVAKDPIGTKGARVTSHISLPGRYLVYMPTVDHVGISRRIEDDAERQRLREVVEADRPPGTGFIVRTACEGVDARYLQNDMRLLIKLWSDILTRRDQVQPPELLYAEPDLNLRATRDLFTTNLDQMVMDNQEDFQRVQNFVATFMPEASGRLELYTGSEPIFDAYGIELEINRALARKVWLPSGGYIVIDHTEAMTCIDVNTGRYVGNTNLEETIVKINLEAVEEIVYQLRLRGIGGLIIIDFIDMEKATNRETVSRALDKALQEDKVKTNALPISEFGLVEMTRKRVRESIVQYLCQECPYCEGKGYVKSRETVAYEILRELLREVEAMPGQEIMIQANPSVVEVLDEQERESLRNLERGFGRRIRLMPNRSFHVEQYELATEL